MIALYLESDVPSFGSHCRLRVAMCLRGALRQRKSIIATSAYIMFDDSVNIIFLAAGPSHSTWSNHRILVTPMVWSCGLCGSTLRGAPATSLGANPKFGLYILLVHICTLWLLVPYIAIPFTHPSLSSCSSASATTVPSAVF